MNEVRIGVIGGGLMGREAAAAFGRWAALDGLGPRPRLAAVCDLDAERRAWFEQNTDVELSTPDHRELLAADLDVVYVAVPHNLHETIYLDVIDAGVDLLGEKPFGIDLAASQRIVDAIDDAGVFARCSSEMPFFPGAQRAIEYVAAGGVGRIIEARCAFLHASDLDLDKPINWKRQVATCGEIGVMGDLGMHVAHVPLRLGWQPTSVYATLQDIVTTRPGPDGAPVPCDTVDNATLTCTVDHSDGRFPLTLETKRIAPGHANSWEFEVLGLDGGVAFSTRSPQTLRRFRLGDGGEQIWEEVQPGHRSVFPQITGGIFEFGFTDALLQMWAAFMVERAGTLDGRFGCATPHEALASHRVFAAALESAATGGNAPITPPVSS